MFKKNITHCIAGIIFILVFPNASLLKSQSLIKKTKDNTSPNFNPLIPDFVADPSLVCFDNVFYLYGTTDIDKGLKEAGIPVVWKSTDFVNWSFSGTIINGIDWSKSYDYTDEKGTKKTGYFRYWAPGKPIKKNNQYYLFATIVSPNEKTGTYVLVSGKPEGPFRFINGKGVYFNDSANIVNQAKPLIDDIDGEPFVDDDGSVYVYWRRRLASKVSDDFLSLEGEKVSIPTRWKGYSEGPLLFHRNNLYYYIYTLSGNANYCNAYMISRKGPLGPFEAPEGNNIFIHSEPGNNVWGPGHGNVFQVPGKDEFIFLYLEYGEGGTTRQVFANRMQFNADGTIVTLTPDIKGIGYLVEPRSAKQNIALGAKVSASSCKQPKTISAKIIADPNTLTNLEVNTKNGDNVERQFTYFPEKAVDGSNGTKWQAGDNDKSPWFLIDLGNKVDVSRCEIYFTIPTCGHAWKLEKSANGKQWKTCQIQDSVRICSPQVASNVGKTRYLRLSMTKGSPGIWEIKLYN